jgi:hypothetical protein
VLLIEEVTGTYLGLRTDYLQKGASSKFQDSTLKEVAKLKFKYCSMTPPLVILKQKKEVLGRTNSILYSEKTRTAEKAKKKLGGGAHKHRHTARWLYL